jgi:hypothetical protein
LLLSPEGFGFAVIPVRAQTGWPNFLVVVFPPWDCAALRERYRVPEERSLSRSRGELFVASESVLLAEQSGQEMAEVYVLVGLMRARWDYAVSEGKR